MATATGTPTVQTIPTNYAFATAVLTALGPSFVTQNNVNNFVAWMQGEEPASSWNNNNNPLNVSNPPGTPAINSTYPSLPAAVQGTASVIKQSNMQAIYQALATNAPYQTFINAVNGSPWGTHDFPSMSGGPIVTANAQVVGNVKGQPGTLSGSATTTASTSSSAGCNQGSKGLNLDPGSSLPLVGGLFPKTTFGNACQLKALAGGLMVGLGGIVTLTGLILVVAGAAANTRVGKTALGVAGTVIPEGRVAGALSGAGRSSGASRAISGSMRSAARQAEKDLKAEQARQDREQSVADEAAYQQARREAANPSEKRQQYERDRRAAKRATTSGPF